MASFGSRITSADLSAVVPDPYGIRVTISKQELFYEITPESAKKEVGTAGAFQQYLITALTSLNQLLENSKFVPDVSFTLQFNANCNERPGDQHKSAGAAPLFMHDSKDRCMPAITFPSYDWYWQATNGFLPGSPNRFDMQPDVPWEQRKNIALFRGGPYGWDCSRLRLLALGNRSDLVGKLDVKPHHCANPDLADRLQKCNVSWSCQKADFLDPSAQKHYKYLIEVDGNGADFRLKNMMLSGSVVFKVTSEMSEFWSDGLQPWQHFIPVDRTKLETELPRLITWAQENDQEARKIANAGLVWAREFLTYHMMHAYQLEVLREYSKRLVDPVSVAGMTRFCCAQLEQLPQYSVGLHPMKQQLAGFCTDSKDRQCNDTPPWL